MCLKDGQLEPAALISNPVESSEDRYLGASVFQLPQPPLRIQFRRSQKHQWCDKLTTPAFCGTRDIERQLLGSYN